LAVLIDKDTRVIVQGITGHQGTYHSRAMRDFGTNVVAGTTPGKGGQVNDGLPVYDAVAEAKERHDANASVIFVPAPYAMDAVLESIEAGIEVIAVITEHIPVHDAMRFVEHGKARGATIIGPNCPGLATPGEAKLGILPNKIFKDGHVGVVSRSGTLTYEIVDSLSSGGMGQSTCLGLGGDPVNGTNFVEALELFNGDDDTEAVVLVGEIGGTAEEEAAAFVKARMKKPVVAYIAGRSAPPGKRMGHAGAIISRGRGTAESKMKAFEDAGVGVAATPAEIPKLVKAAL
jgi:succinyl-CoA synthetase alpha subunit